MSNKLLVENPISCRLKSRNIADWEESPTSCWRITGYLEVALKVLVLLPFRDCIKEPRHDGMVHFDVTSSIKRRFHQDNHRKNYLPCL